MSQDERSKFKDSEAPAQSRDAATGSLPELSSADFDFDAIYKGWRPGGTGRLMSRVRGEFDCGADYADPVTGNDLVRLLDRYKDHSLPMELQAILRLELFDKRKTKPGPKKNQALIEEFQLTLLPLVYARGSRKVKRLKSWMKQRDEQRPRKAKTIKLPTVRAVACHYVRKWLPRYRDITDAAISNLISKQRKPPRYQPRTSSLIGWKEGLRSVAYCQRIMGSYYSDLPGYKTRTASR